MIRLINITLTLLAVYGGSVAFRESSLNRELSEVHRTLAAETGYLDLPDSNKLHVVALPSEDPLHFRWRIYLPDQCTILWKTINQWGDVGDSLAGPQNFIAQIRLRKNDNGFVRVFKDLESLGGVGTLGGRELQEFMHDHWDGVEIHQLGSNVPATVEPHEITTLLRLQLPRDIADEAKAVLPARWAGQVVPILYHVQFGSKEAWQTAELGKAATGATNR